jgi:predicted RNA-binding Zn-ribbon protein involved in translation (DUF1610 family)
MLWVCDLLASGKNFPGLEGERQSLAVASTGGKATPSEEASYVCDACGEEVVIPLDLTEDSSQTYVEDCLSVAMRTQSMFTLTKMECPKSGRSQNKTISSDKL